MGCDCDSDRLISDDVKGECVADDSDGADWTALMGVSSAM